MNTVRLAAAGAGKTWKICNEAISAAHCCEDAKNILIVTYTNKGVDSIHKELELQNMGVIPPKIRIMSWYQFLLKELIRPYQTFIAGINEVRSFDYSLEHSRNFAKSGTKCRYITGASNVRSEEASNLVMLLNQKSNGLVFSRLGKIYAQIFIDEIQDMAGRDLDLLSAIFQTEIHVTCVGDNKQATFQTHTTRANKKMSGANIFDFFAEAEKQGVVKIEKNLCSRRFNADICDFANRVFPNENCMTTSMRETTGHDGIFLIERKDAHKYYSNFHPQELRYSRTNADVYGLFAVNFGECKGQTYERCLIHPSKPIIEFLKGKGLSKNQQKYYVALTRAKYSNAIIVEKLFSAVGFEPCEIEIENGVISALKYKREE